VFSDRGRKRDHLAKQSDEEESVSNHTTKVLQDA
jgi:hypothetical protein